MTAGPLRWAFSWLVLNIIMPRRVFNLERDVRRTNRIVDKIRADKTYAQNFYAALCNNRYQPQDVFGILSNIIWDCTWSYSALIVSDIREDDSYHHWYCSGTGFTDRDFFGFVEESYVTEEIETDIKDIGWLLLTRRFFD